MTISGWTLRNASSRGISHISAKASTATSFSAAPVAPPRKRSVASSKSTEAVLDLDEEGLSTGAEGKTVRLALEQLLPKILLERPHTVGDGARCHVQLARRLSEALMPPGRVKEPKHFKRRSVCRSSHEFDPGGGCCPVPETGPPRIAWRRSGGDSTENQRREPER